METIGLTDIIGPVMVGPSSSHTAGAARIGCMARSLLGAPPVRAAIHLYGSFAETGPGHGTDRALVGGLLGFLLYNHYPAKVFMGDTGSTFLGYILATLSITGLFKMYAIISFAVPFLILGIPIFDISFAFLRRIAHGQNPMKADRGHFHHRLIDMGFSQKQAVAIAYMLTGILGLAAVLLTSSGELKALILIAAIFIVSAIGFKLIFAKNDRSEDEPEEKQEEPHE